MSHCALVARKPICFEFTPEAAVVITSSRKCPGRLFQTRGPATAKLLSPNVCAWNNTRSVGRRTQATSRPFRDQKYVVRQVRRCMARQRREDKTCEFKVNSSLDLKPVQLAQHWRDVFPPSNSNKKSGGGILDRLNLPDVAVRHAVKQRITIAQATRYERLDESSGCFMCQWSHYWTELTQVVEPRPA